MKLILVLLALSSDTAIELNRNETLFHHDERIIGGQESTKAIPYISVIEQLSNGSYDPFCYGAIISNRSILTSSICAWLCEYEECKIFVGRLQVHSSGQQLNLLKASAKKNIGILRVSTISFSQNVQSIPLPKQDLTEETEATIAGWGSKKSVFIVISFFLLNNLTKTH